MLRLFLEFGDPEVLVGVHDAEAAGLLKGNLQDGDGAVRAGFLVGLQHLLIVHLVDVVAGEDQHVVRVVAVDEVEVLVDGVGRALVPVRAGLGLIGGQHHDAALPAVQVPGLSVADILVQLKGLILGQNAHGVDAGVDAVGQRKVDDAVLPAEADGRFRGLFSQRVEPAALTARQKHGDTFLFLIHIDLRQMNYSAACGKSRRPGEAG